MSKKASSQATNAGHAATPSAPAEPPVSAAPSDSGVHTAVPEDVIAALTKPTVVRADRPKESTHAADPPQADTTSEGAQGEGGDESSPDQAATATSALRAEAAALRAQLQAERALRRAKQQQSGPARQAPEPPPANEQRTDPLGDLQPMDTDDPLVRVVKEALRRQQATQHEALTADQVQRIVEQQVAARVEEYRREEQLRAAQVAALSHVEVHSKELPLVYHFATTDPVEVYEAMADEYAEEYSKSGRRLSVHDAARRLEEKLRAAVNRYSSLLRQEPQPTEQKGRKEAAREDMKDPADDPSAARAAALAALTSTSRFG